MFSTILSNIPQEDIFLLVTLLISTGLFAGIIAGLFGVGGGVVVVPALYYVFTLAEVDESSRMHLAVGTSLANIIPTSIISALSHARRKSVDLKLIKVMAYSVLGGVVLGALVVSSLKGSTLMLIYSSLLFLVSLQFFFWKDSWRISKEFPKNYLRHIFGSSIGFLSVIIGIGGGSLSIPLLKLYNFEIHRAIGTGAAIGTLIAIPGTIGFILSGIINEVSLPLTLGYVNLLGLIMITPMTMLAAPFGVRFAHYLHKDILSRIFSIFIFIMAARLFLEWLNY